MTVAPSTPANYLLRQQPTISPREGIHSCTNTPPSSTSSTGLYVSDRTSGTKFLVDTGAFRSIYPASASDRRNPSTTKEKLIAANGSNIPTYGYQNFTLTLRGRRYPWKFIVADVRTPLLGADFLGHHGLLVDIANKRLLDVASCQTSPLQPSPHPPTVCSIVTQNDQFSPFLSLRQEFPEVFRPELHQTPSVPAKHGIYHHITTNGPPVFSKFRRLSPEKLQAAKDAFHDMEKMGLCQKASSPWASPLHMVKKPDGTWRPCGDYRRLNLITVPDHYPLPNMADLTSTLHGAKVFSKLDLLKGYFQVPVHPDDIPKTAIVTPFGSYTFSYSTFGLRNSGATFQRLMDGILGNIPFCICYVDDILIFSKTVAEHQEHIRTILGLLRDNGLVVRFDKCVFGASSVEFLGHDVSSKGIRPMHSKVDAVQKFPAPTTVKGLQEFVGMVNYYHRFLPNAAQTMQPLYSALSGKPKTLLWGPDQQRSFIATKDALASATTLVFPAPGAPLTLTTDASNVAVGAVLEQEVNGVLQPLGFFSRKLRPAQTQYSTFDRELLAVHLSVRHFRHLLEGTPFTIRTDHQPLIHAFSKTQDAWSPRQQRHLSAIAEFGCTIQHIPGKKNPVADALSRIQIDSVHLGINYNDVADAQEKDPDTHAYRTAITSLQWKDVPFGDQGRTLLCDVSTNRPRPFIPSALRRKVFDIIHGLSHPSGRSTAKLISEKFVWHGINRDVRNWARCCIPCQTSKVTRHTESGIGNFPQPKRRFGHLHVDIVGPLPVSDGARYIFTSTERSTRWPEAIPIKEATSQACAEALLSGWISRFGVPDSITSDRGSTFTSHIWTSLATLMGTKVHHTTAYNPEANGMAERTHRTLKAALKARCTGPDWKAQLPWVLLGLRTSPKEGLQVSPAEMVFGEALTVPGEFFPPSAADSISEADLNHLRRTVGKYKPCIQTHKNTRQQYIPKTLETCHHAFIRNDAHKTPLTRPYRGPYLILQRDAKAYLLRIDGRQDWISIDRLKPAYLEDNDPPPVTLSRSGRPILPPTVFQS